MSCSAVVTLFFKIYVLDDEGRTYDYFGWIDEVDQVLTSNANGCGEIGGKS